jgi:acetyltransferase
MSGRAFDSGGCDYRRLCHPIHTGIGEVVVRPIGPADVGMVQSFVVGLSATSRYYRFLAPVQELSPRMLDLLTRTDPPHLVALIGIAQAEGRQSLVAEARYVLNDDAGGADIAIVVADAWQRRGVGTAILAMLERIAMAAGIVRLMGESLATNDPFVHFAGRCGFAIQADHEDRRVLRVEKHLNSGAPDRTGRRHRCSDD